MTPERRQTLVNALAYAALLLTLAAVAYRIWRDSQP